MSKTTNNLFIKNLIDFGLSEKEAAVYISLLELELAGVNEIAKKAEINRSSAYVILESLKVKGLVGTSDDKKVRQYVASSPEMLHRVASDMAKKQEDIRNSINEILPELKALNKNAKHKPKVTVFEGKEGLIAAFEDSLINNTEKLMRVSSSPGNLAKIIPQNYLIQYVQKRLKNGIRMNGIHPDDETHRGYIINSPKNIDTYLLIPKEKHLFTADFAIYENKIGFMSDQDEGIAIIIESKVISDVVKNIFDLAWSEAKKIGKEINGY